MDFKKDYLNYILHSLLKKNPVLFENKRQLKDIFFKIISGEDLARIIFIVGKTAGFEILFKYLLYISDKIDKSQVTIFNLKENSDYDVEHLEKICSKINIPVSESERSPDQENIELPDIAYTEEVNIQETMDESITPETSEQIVTKENEPEEGFVKLSDDKDETAYDETSDVETSDEEASESETSGEEITDSEEQDGPEKEEMLLIENKDEIEEDEIYKLNDITDNTDEPPDIIHDERAGESTDEDKEDDSKEKESEPAIEEEIDIIIERKKPSSEDEEVKTDEEMLDEELKDDEKVKEEDEVIEDEQFISDDIIVDEETIEDEPVDIKENDVIPDEKEEEVEIEIVKSKHTDSEPVKEEQISNEVYYRFEEKFFIESKILEKLFENILREIREEPVMSMNEQLKRSCSEVVGISLNLSNITRKLAFDLTADILLTMGLYFTRVIKYPYLLFRDKVDIMKDSLKLIAALVRNENYLNYDTVIDRIEEVKNELMQKPPVPPAEKPVEKKIEPEEIPAEKEQPEEEYIRSITEPVIAHKKEEPQPKKLSELTDEETIVFKMKYLVKEFEKNFESMKQLTGDYGKFEVLEKINDLNNYLRMLAKLGSILNYQEVVKLSEVTYVFLKYIKDYRMDLMDPEIKQVINYIVFSFKMLLKNRKPEDFNVLVEYLNNPVKIFTDT